MAEKYCKLRTELIVHSEPDGSAVVKDPIANKFYRFNPIQTSVLDLLRGQLDYATVSKVVSDKHGVEVSEAQVEEFVNKLESFCLLDSQLCWSRLERNRRQGKQKLFQTLLCLKIFSFNPDNLLAKLEKRVRFCFELNFAFVVASTIAISLVILALNWKSLFLSMASLLSVYSIPFILLVVFSVMTIHELAHGVALKHYGGRVQEMGFMVLYFIPALYCNVSDAWMLNKRQRLWVTLAGSYMQIYVCALAILAWRVLAPETLASRICLVIIGFTTLQTLLNFNPLIRLDGYYLLSDLIEIPNLRPKALAYVKDRIRSLLTGTAESKLEVSSREKRLFAYYGTCSLVFTAALVFVVLHRLGEWMIREYQSWGLFLLSILCLLVVPIGNKESKAQSKKMLKLVVRRSRKAPWIFVFLLLIIVTGFLPWQLKISGDFTIVAFNKVSVTPQVAGNLKKIYVEQGSRVKAGDLLAEMENLELVNDYQETKGELASQRASLDLLIAGSRPEEIEKAIRLVETKKAELYNASRIDQERAVLLETIAKKEAELANARINHERMQKLLETGLIARNEADKARTVYEVQEKELSEAKGRLKVLEEQTERVLEIKRKELAQAESELKILLAGSRKEAIRAVESQVKKLEERLLILSREIDLLKIRSPIDGIVATSYLRNRVGDFLDKGRVFCEIVSEGTVLLEMPVPEKEIGDVHLGLPITIKIRGYPKRWYRAHVSSIAPTAAVHGSERTVIVQGMLENPDGSLKEGMTGVGKILCGEKMIFEILTRRLIRWLRTEFWEYLP